MKKTIKLIGVFFILFILSFSLIAGESLEDKLQSMAAENAKMYITPLVTAFGTALNSGWYHSAKPHKLLGFDLGIKLMGVSIVDEETIFKFAVPDFEQDIMIGGNNYSLLIEGAEIYPERDVPTFFGDKNPDPIQKTDNASIVDMIESQLINQGMSQTILDQPAVQNQLNDLADGIPNLPSPPGIGVQLFGLAIPQAAIGLSIPMTPIKAEVVARGLPEYDLPNFGKFKFGGIGGKFKVDQFIPVPMFPLDLAVGAYFQKMSIGDIFESNHSTFNFQIGKDINLLVLGLGLYGGAGIESSDVKIDYTYMNADNPSDPLNGVPIKFDLEGDNKFRITAGAHIRLAILNISADYSKGADDVFTIGAGITLR